MKRFLPILLLPLALLLVSAPLAQAQDEEKVKPYAHESSKGKTYYLFSRVQELKNSDKTVTLYYFTSDPENKKGNPVAKVPADRQVSETKTGMLVLKKKE